MRRARVLPSGSGTSSQLDFPSLRSDAYQALEVKTCESCIANFTRPTGSDQRICPRCQPQIVTKDKQVSELHRLIEILEHGPKLYRIQ